MCRSLNIRCRVCANASARMQQTGKLRRSPHSHQTFARAYFPTWTKSGMHAYSAYANDEIQRQPWCRSLRSVNRNTYAVEARLCNVVKGKWANSNAKKIWRHIIFMQSRCRVLYAEDAFNASTSYDTQAQTIVHHATTQGKQIWAIADHGQRCVSWSSCIAQVTPHAIIIVAFRKQFYNYEKALSVITLRFHSLNKLCLETFWWQWRCRSYLLRGLFFACAGLSDFVARVFFASFVLGFVSFNGLGLRFLVVFWFLLFFTRPSRSSFRAKQKINIYVFLCFLFEGFPDLPCMRMLAGRRRRPANILIHGRSGKPSRS